MRVAFLSLAAVALLAGCAGSAEELAEGPTAEVEVQNRNWLSMELFARSPGRRVRLGRVAAGGSKSFTLPPSLFEGGATPITFEMETVGSEGETLFDRQTVAPGDVVVLIIPNTR
ncbi:hypothetical protein [Rubrivirga sp.]|uniref:hypothetical protein n=1 Tax=Rubrivirga sp. TaxID=1885344 RepID=UPI003B527020